VSDIRATLAGGVAAADRAGTAAANSSHHFSE
jgi:hypothetical protein